MGSLAPLANAPLLVQLHVALGLTALVVGTLRVAWPHAQQRDRLFGWAFLVLLAATAVTAIFLAMPPGTPHVLGISLGRLFVIATAIGIIAAIRTAHRPNRLVWRNIVTALFAGVLLTCGLFEMAPGRLMNTVLAGG